MGEALTEEQYNELFDYMDMFCAALDKGDTDEVLEVGKKIPFPPRILKGMKEIYGKDYILERGFNLRHANAAYGNGWLDEQ